jgi:hypothetical protein
MVDEEEGRRGGLQVGNVTYGGVEQPCTRKTFSKYHLS